MSEIPWRLDRTDTIILAVLVVFAIFYAAGCAFLLVFHFYGLAVVNALFGSPTVVGFLILRDSWRADAEYEEQVHGMKRSRRREA